MIVLCVERVTPGVRGYLSRWFVQIRPGVFVANLSARIRDALWQNLESSAGIGGAIMLWSDHTHPQGYEVRQTGEPRRPLRDFDGLFLPQKPLQG